MSRTLEESAQYLSQSNDYQILKRFVPSKQYQHNTEAKKLIGIYLDTETTGLDYNNDKIIELALVPFEYDTEGNIYKILDCYTSFQDPDLPIKEQITLLTGITEDMVKGQSIDHNVVEGLVKTSSLIIAHNAGFDRKFVEKQFPIFKQKAWGCGYKQILWNKENISSAKLEYLAYKFGFFYDAHRAEMDCLVGIHLLTQSLPISKELAFKTLLDQMQKRSYIIWAINSPFSTKDLLKARGYRWNDGSNGKPKSWYIEVNELEKDKEESFLYQDIYQKKVDLIIDEINAFNRFSVGY